MTYYRPFRKTCIVILYYIILYYIILYYIILYYIILYYIILYYIILPPVGKKIHLGLRHDLQNTTLTSIFYKNIY
jgi:hypothetical protein